MRRAKIIKLNILELEDILPEHFEGSPNITDKETLLSVLGLIYNKLMKSFDKITRIEVEYLD